MIDKSACPQCDEYIRPYGCTNHRCPIYMDWEEGMKEMGADFEHEKRKDNRLNPIFEQALRPFKGEV